jgi:hypothetical protein
MYRSGVSDEMSHSALPSWRIPFDLGFQNELPSAITISSDDWSNPQMLDFNRVTTDRGSMMCPTTLYLSILKSRCDQKMSESHLNPSCIQTNGSALVYHWYIDRRQMSKK